MAGFRDITPTFQHSNFPVRLYSITPILLFCAEFMNGFNHGDDVIDRSFGQDAVTEIENMAWPTAGAAENFRYSTFDFLR